MSELRLHYAAHYLARHVTPTPGEIVFAGQNFVKALKGEKFIGRQSTFTFLGEKHTITRDNLKPVYRCTARFIRKIVSANAKGPVVLIPMPGSKQAVGTTAVSLLEKIALAAAKDIPGVEAQAVSAIRWDQEMLSLHKEGGERSRSHRHQHMNVVADIPPGAVFLVDDVATTGNTLLAAKDRLWNDRKRKVTAAIAAAFTVHESPDPVFGDFVKDLPLEPGFNLDDWDF